jgi:NAD(P)-dependent dehydrogenase (short-subunit alcohol dehydrogenase family)
MLAALLLASTPGMVASSPSRTYLVTGATEGIGLETCKQLQSQGHTVLVHGRNAAKVENVVQSLKEQDSSKAHTGFVYDLSSMAAVREFGADVIRQYPSLDGLLNNAGSFDGDYSGSKVVTDEGNEYTLAVNVLAPFLLTSLLLPSLKASGHGRVIISSSVSMGAPDALSDLQLESSYSAHRAYSLSKLCDAMLSQELHCRYGDPPRLTFNTMDPTSQCGSGCDTKMLRAGWGNWGAPASQSTISAEMLASARWAERSGEGFSSRREVANPAIRKQLWDDCVALTGATWPDDEQH